MNDYIFSALNCLESFADEVLSCLNKYLNCNIIGNMVALNQFTADFVLCFGCARKSYFNFLKAHINKRVEKFKFFFHIHRVNKRLIAVTQVNTAPYRCFCNYIVWPFSVFKLNLLKRNILFKSWFHIKCLLINCTKNRP